MWRLRGDFPFQTYPGEFVFVGGEVDDAAARDAGEGAGCVVVGGALHFDRADKVAAQARAEPFFDPFEEAGRIADDVRAHPVLGAEVFGFEGKGVVFAEGDVWFCHEVVPAGGTVDGGDRRAEAVKDPGPAAGAGACVDNARGGAGKGSEI